MTFKKFFHYISYLQYPLMAIALFFALQPYYEGLEKIKENPTAYFENVNSILIFTGLGISFSSLQDTTKTQNKLSLKVYRSPIGGKLFIVVIILLMSCIMIMGLVGYFSIEQKIVKELSVGLIVMGLGMFGFLKAAVEMFENHRIDKNPIIED